nr:hypothetical protein [Acholeplasmatales bacterium]
MSSKKKLVIFFSHISVFIGLFFMIFGIMSKENMTHAADYSYDEETCGAKIDTSGDLVVTFNVTSGINDMTWASCSMINWVVFLFSSDQINYEYNEGTHKYVNSANMNRDNVDYYFMSDSSQNSGLITVTIPTDSMGYQGGDETTTSDDYLNHSTGKTFSEIFAGKNWYISIGPFWKYNDNNYSFNVDYFVERGFTVLELYNESDLYIKAEPELEISISDWTYGSTASTPIVTASEGSGEQTIEYKGENDSSYTTTVPTKPGNYTVKVSVAQSATYSKASATANFTI